MADAASFRTYLRDVIGVTDPRQRREAVQEQGLDTISDFLEFDKDGIETLCSSVRKPGGTIPNPNANVVGAPATIPNPGYSISAISEKRLIAAAYTANLYDMIGRAITAETMSRSRLKAFDKHRVLIKEHEDPEKMPMVSKTFGIVKAMDLVPSHLRDRLGVRKVPLTYVIRDTVATGNAPLPEAASNTSADFDNITDELIEFTPHSGEGYSEDNAKVFQILQDMVSGTSFESSIKSHQRERDGRAAYLALVQHNLGSSKWDKILEDAETYVLRREWNGRNHRFTLRSHINKQREANNEFQRASQHVEYAVPNEHTMVGRLIKSITTKEPAIVSAITHIQGSPTLRSDFEAAADFLLLTAPSNTNNNSNQRVSAVRGEGRGNNNSNANSDVQKGPNTGVELRYYTKKEYSKLSHEQRKELATLRGKGGNANGNNSVSVSALKQQFQDDIKDLETRLIAAISTSNEANKNTPSTRQPLQNPLNQRESS